MVLLGSWLVFYCFGGNLATPHCVTVPYPHIDQATLCLVKTILMPVLMEDEPWFPRSARNLIIHRLSSLFFHDLISNLLIKSKHNNSFHISLFSMGFFFWGGEGVEAGVWLYVSSYHRVGFYYMFCHNTCKQTPCHIINLPFGTSIISFVN